jgi:hypothetical protein
VITSEGVLIADAQGTIEQVERLEVYAALNGELP